MEQVECYDLPETADPSCIYRLLPKDFDEGFYRERTDRNLGWITEQEQWEILRNSVVGIAGCGGMGGMLAHFFLRLGVGEVRIADPEIFDRSNINRQFAAGKHTIGKQKAVETARATRKILDDGTLVVYPQGVREDVVNHFLKGCSVVLDEIEFWAVAARILLHQRARRLGVDLFNGNSVGAGTRLFFFEPDGFTMEELLGFSYEEAVLLQSKADQPDVRTRIMAAVIEGLVPELPEYCATGCGFSNRQEAYRRLLDEGRAMIISTNPPMAAGFLANHVLFYLLRHSSVKRDVRRPVPAPGYLLVDAMKMEAKVVSRRERSWRTMVV